MFSEKKIIILIAILSIAILGYWVFQESKPKPGAEYEDEGREHVDIGTAVAYKTNPPTSGNHYAQWTKWGVYDTPRDDRNLVHSLEHGYVILSYNCDVAPTSLISIPQVFAQESARPMSIASDSPEEIASMAATLSENFKSANCQELVQELTQIYNDRGQTRLIVVPRPNMDSRIAISAWMYLVKMNSLNKSQINDFISGHLNQGPEKTIE